MGLLVGGILVSTGGVAAVAGAVTNSVSRSTPEESADARQIRSIFTPLVTRSVLAGAIPAGTASSPEDTAALAGFVADPAAHERRVDLLIGSVSPTLVGEYLAAIEHGLAEAVPAHNPDWWFVDATFVVDEWQGIEVHGDTATVRALTTQRFTLLDGTHTQDPQLRSEYTLERAPGTPFGWLMTAVSARQVSPEAG
ncbi:hypothetical protein D9V34_08470 [Mycetocola lacteus]|uniref:Tim44-like domain-containing protein n=1 Tax=Mycetocola lacteus TaxID=76637 RepID=A0A3L7ARX0_9MICO|nr:hypothetical protein D9V34_08470 [Mycetocola lacteus]